MAYPYIGEIRLFAGNFAPTGWAFCDGSLINIWDNEPLFQLTGTTYGGDGMNTFALPDLRGRVPIHMGQNPTTGTTYNVGQTGGVETVTLTAGQIPAHTHGVSAQSQSGTKSSPEGNVWSQSTVTQFATQVDSSKKMHPNAISAVGNNQSHDNMMPYVAINYIISLYGVFPSQT